MLYDVWLDLSLPASKTCALSVTILICPFRVPIPLPQRVQLVHFSPGANKIVEYVPSESPRTGNEEPSEWVNLYTFESGTLMPSCKSSDDHS